MKKLSLLLCGFVLGYACLAQNPFANAAFYDAVKKIYADGKNGFPLYTGKKYNSIGNFYSIHKSKLMLPGADSGQISQPGVIGSPSANFYFSGGTVEQQAAQKMTNLVQALRTAVGISLYESRQTDSLKQFVFQRLFLSDKPLSAANLNALFEAHYVKERGKFIVSLSFKGNLPKPVVTTPPVTEPELENKMNRLLASMMNLFADELGMLTTQNDYYTQYASKTKLYGETATIKERKFETSFSFQLSSPKLTSATAAKEIFEKLKAIFIQSGKFSFKNETVEGTRTWVFASEAGATSIKSRFSLVLEYYSSENYPSVGFLITRKK